MPRPGSASSSKPGVGSGCTEKEKEGDIRQDPGSGLVQPVSSLDKTLVIGGELGDEVITNSVCPISSDIF